MARGPFESVTQIPLFRRQTRSIINVASVPQRSPFRYPGGKTWFIPRLRTWLLSKARLPEHLIEPFAGGGIVSLTAAAERLANHVTMVELDEEIAAVWKTILEGDATWLAHKIAGYTLTPEAVRATLEQHPSSLREQAFRTILKNRVSRSGIIAAGAGLIKSGENGRGLGSRWYPETLQKRILDIVRWKERLTFIAGDGLTVLKANVRRQDAVFFLDPPYTAGGKRAGSRLYTYWQLNHEELFRTVGGIAGDFLMTYDDDEAILELARGYNFDTEVVAMKNSHHAQMTELLIGRDLDWART